MAKRYTATLSRGQGRTGWSVIFRHPVLIDPATDKPGRRVRRGLGTDDQGRAEAIVAEINQLLGDERYWTPAARAEAAHRFSALAVEIFFDKMAPEATDPAALREALLPVADREGFIPKRVALVGTTGAGKTTVLRHLIGTSPAERFPSTSAARTTMHDVEVVARPGSYRAVVTFTSHDEVEEYLKENLVSALMVARVGADDRTILRRILVHADERMRFNYVLGNGPVATAVRAEEIEPTEEGEEADALVAPPPTLAGDMARTNDVLASAVATVRALAPELERGAREAVSEADIGGSSLEWQHVQEYLERLAREDPRFHALVDRLMDELRHRFSYLDQAALRRSTTGWPTAWTMESDDRGAFLRAVRRFSSNHAALFGQLLTPLVSGVRVAGPFAPAWAEDGEITPVVYMDSEGLGPTPPLAAALSSSLARRIADADAVLLVDDAKQPIQAAPEIALRELVASGRVGALFFAFTHMDAIVGDNLPTERARRDHVLAAARTVVRSIGQWFGDLAERGLGRRLDDATFFLGYLDRPIDPTAGRRQAMALEELQRLWGALTAGGAVLWPGRSRPTYHIAVLSMTLAVAVRRYLELWGERLGLSSTPVQREPWARVKALARRMATPGMGDEYDGLRPVADFRRLVMEAAYAWIQSPSGWTGAMPAREERLALYQTFAEGISRGVLEVAARRVRDERLAQWQEAYGMPGPYAAGKRARLIHGQILTQAAASQDIPMTPEGGRFMVDMIGAVREAAEATGIEVMGM